MPASSSEPLVVIANRDEVLSRPTRSLARWTDGSGVIAGVDLEAGGTWMGISPSRGRVAMVTNVREPRELAPRRADEPSRGALVRDFLVGDRSAADFVAHARGAAMRGFNLIAIDHEGAHWCSNRGGEPTRLSPGIHGVSNALLDTPWPKVVRAKTALERALSSRSDATGGVDEEALFSILADDRRAEDDALPDTGVGLELERALSPIRIALPGYGTRASTVLVVRDATSAADPADSGKKLAADPADSRRTFRMVERSLAPTSGEVALEGAFG